MKDLMITYAQDASGKLVHVESACKERNYYCLECKEELSLRVSKIPKGEKFYRRPHFAHRKDSLCHPETVLHNQFKKMAAEKLQSCLTEHKPLRIDWGCDECYERHQHNLLEGIATVKLEYWLKDCQPDIALLSADNTLKTVIEVVVKHKPEPQVVRFYKDHGIIMIRIDLQSFDDLDRLEDRLKAPTKVAYCLSPVCEICGNRKNSAEMLIIGTSCWKCNNQMKMAMIVGAERGYVLGPNNFTQEEINLAKQNGVMIERRYSKTVENSYLANVCNTCNAFIGQFYLHEHVLYLHEYLEESHQSLDVGKKCFQCIENKRF